MDPNEAIMCNPKDHIMANTWRLIFEPESRTPDPARSSRPATDFASLEQLLPEYRRIGLYLADRSRRRRYQ